MHFVMSFLTKTALLSVFPSAHALNQSLSITRNLLLQEWKSVLSSVMRESESGGRQLGGSVGGNQILMLSEFRKVFVYGMSLSVYECVVLVGLKRAAVLVKVTHLQTLRVSDSDRMMGLLSLLLLFSTTLLMSTSSSHGACILLSCIVLYRVRFHLRCCLF